jgi:ParB-like chromosome segregation protein Spo0J
MPSSRPVVWSIETWPIDVLADTIRHDLSDEKVLELVAALKRGFDMPPIFVLMADGAVKILDGHHRVVAWKQAGFQAVPVLVGRVK